MSTPSVVDVVETYYEQMWNQWDDTVVDDVLAPDFLFRGSLGRVTQGRPAWRDYRDMVRRGAEDYHHEIVQMVADGDQVGVRLEITGTHTGPILGAPATGLRFAYPGAAFLTVSEGLLIDAWILGDLGTLREQVTRR